jgi:glycosyltransferase involved in cell wall biosynthesis
MKGIVSIVLAYFNRKQQCMMTLDSFQRSESREQIEVIIVDDGSSAEHALSDILLKSQYSFPIKLWRVRDSCKTWRNPVIAYNFGISKASGEWIVLQNPEVCHMGDICQYVQTKCDPNVYYAFQVFATKSQHESDLVNQHATDLAWVSSQLGKQIQGQWYCHSRYRPKAYHFCTAIHRSKMELVGGFNPIFQDGIDYDDDELLCRISRVCRVVFVNDPRLFGIHLWHPSFAYQGDRTVVANLQAKNKARFIEVLNHQQIIKIETEVDEALFTQIN